MAPESTVYDIGADIGFFTILSAHLVGPAGCVESFEPVPGSAAAVAANVRANGFSNVHVHQNALGARSGIGTLHVRNQASWSHLSDRGAHGTIHDRIDVRILNIDEEVSSGLLRPPDVMKIDVEGSEVDVLTGARETLERFRPTLIVETHETNVEVCALLASHGYAVENLDGTEDVAEAGPVHLLARPRRP